MTDAQIIESYWQRNENAIAETNNKYGAYCRCIADNILHNSEDSEECINDTWLKTWNSIPTQRPQYFRIFLAKITRNLAFNKYKSKTADKRGGGEVTAVLDELAECVAGSSDVETDIMTKELGAAINQFLCTLSSRDGNVFIRRYFFTESIAAISKQYDLSENHIMVILSRTRKKLKIYLKKEGYIL